MPFRNRAERRDWLGDPASHVNRFNVIHSSCVSHPLIVTMACIVLLGCSPKSPNTGTRYDKPLTYAQATREKDITFPLPLSARNIYFGEAGAWQACTMIARFDAPAVDCIKHIDTVVACDNKNYNRTSSYARVSVTNIEPVDTGFIENASWFNPHRITRGIHVGESGSHVPQIWVDLDRGTFYFRLTD